MSISIKKPELGTVAISSEERGKIATILWPTDTLRRISFMHGDYVQQLDDALTKMSQDELFHVHFLCEMWMCMLHFVFKVVGTVPNGTTSALEQFVYEFDSNLTYARIDEICYILDIHYPADKKYFDNPHLVLGAVDLHFKLFVEGKPNISGFQSFHEALEDTGTMAIIAGVVEKYLGTLSTK